MEDELRSAQARYDRAVKGAEAKHAASRRQAELKQPLKDSLGTIQAASKHVLDACSIDANHNHTPTEKAPTGLSSDRRARSAAHAQSAAPPAPPGWEQDFEKWAEFRQKIGDDAWQLWFSKCRVNGSELSICAASPFEVEQIEKRFSDKLSEHFGANVAVKFEQKASAA